MFIMRALSLDLRERIAATLASDPLSTYADLAARFAVSTASVERISRKKRHGQSLVPNVSSGRTPLVTPAEYESFETLAASRTDWTLQSLATAWEAQSGTAVSIATAQRLLKKVQFTFKKSVASPVSGMKPSVLPFGKP